MQSIEMIHPVVPRPERILQYGEGNFLRGFVDWMVDIANEKNTFGGSIVVVQPLASGLSNMINSQKGLYTTILRGIQNAQQMDERRVVASISRCINPYAENKTYLDCAHQDELRFIVSNTTEAGIAYNPNDSLGDLPPVSFPGKITQFLYERFTHFRGAPDKGMVIICCELIEKNATKLQEIVFRLAQEWELEEEFIAWLRNSCDFLNSLVDRIVTGFPHDEIAGLSSELGYTDRLLTSGEIFHLWVIESEKDYCSELNLADAGLNVVWTKDMTPYRTQKVRILNGAHTMTALAAYQMGLDTVGQCMENNLIGSFMHKGIHQEIIPSIHGDRPRLEAYAASVAERFANPHIKHLLLSISLNSVSKFRTRVLPSLIGYYLDYHKLPAMLTFSLAALITFYKGTQVVNGELICHRGNDNYTVKDDPVVLDFFAHEWQDWDGSPQATLRLVGNILSETVFWGSDLREIDSLQYTVAHQLEMILEKGMKSAIEAII